jgi:hypothetical protein
MDLKNPKNLSIEKQVQWMSNRICKFVQSVCNCLRHINKTYKYNVKGPGLNK